MSGQKGPDYKQSGVAIANRNPFNKYVPNKRQTVNDGIAVFCSESGGGIFPSDTVPFNQGVTSQIEVFLFCEDVPTRLAAIFERRSDAQSLGEAGLIEVPAISYTSPQFALNATPTIIDGYTPYTATNGVAYGAISLGTTETAGVKVRGYAVIGTNPEVYATADTRITAAEAVVDAWDSVSLDFSTRSSAVNGYAFYNGTGLADAVATYSIILEESAYTQAIQDAGNIVSASSGGVSLNYIVVGIYKTVVPD